MLGRTPHRELELFFAKKCDMTEKTYLLVSKKSYLGHDLWAIICIVGSVFDFLSRLLWVLFVIFEPNGEVAWILLASPNVPYRSYGSFLVLYSKQLRRKWAKKWLTASTCIVVSNWVGPVYYFVSLLVLSIMNVEAINTQQPFLWLPFPVEFRNSEFLERISRNVTVQKIPFLFVLFFRLRWLFLK